MSYFNNMSVISYPVTSTKTKEESLFLARNILTRARILDDVKQASTTYLQYTIRDGERPEHLAKRVYGRADLHWIILMFNEILNPYFEWPLSSSEVTEVIEKRYAGKTYFIDYKKSVKGGLDFWFETGTKTNIVVNNQVSSTTPIISEWDPNLYKIVVPADSPSGVTQIRQTRSDGFEVIADVKRVVEENKYAVHHFQDADTGETIDHHTPIGSPLRFDDARGNETSSVIDGYIGGAEVISLQNSTVAAVNNYNHEIAVNDKKRIINVMRFELVDLIIKEMRETFVGVYR